MQPGLILAELDGNQFLANLEACAGVYAAASLERTVFWEGGAAPDA